MKGCLKDPKVIAEVMYGWSPRRQGGRKVAASLPLVAAAAVISPAAKNPTLAASIKIQMLFRQAGRRCETS